MSARWWWLAALVMGIVMGPLLANMPGFIMIGSGHTTVELRMSLALAIAVVVAMSLIMLGASAGFLASIDRQMRSWTRAQRQRRARELTANGLRALAEGRWHDAEHDLMIAAKGSDDKLVHYLGAAMAAQEEHALDRRDRYFQQAHATTPENELAVGMMQARLHLRNGHYDHALLVLLPLSKLYPRHAAVLKLLQHVQRRLGDIDALEQLLPRLEKYAVLPPERLLKLRNEIVCTRLKKTGPDLSLIQAYWRSLEKKQRREIDNVCAYARALMNAGAHHAAERVVRSFIGQRFHNQLIALYGDIQGRDASAQLQFAENWTLKRSADTVMLMTLAKLAMRAQQWTKSQRYLNELNRKQGSGEVWLMLAQVYERLAEPDQMMACIKAALEQTKKDVSASVKGIAA